MASPEPRESLGSRVRRLASDLDVAARSYGVSRSHLLLHLAHLGWGHGLWPREAHRDGTSNPRLPDRRLAGAIPESRLTRLQARLNPPDLVGLLTDKAFFHGFCVGAGLPVPALHGIFDRPCGFRSDGTSVSGPHEWELLLANSEDDIVVKPARGRQGRGVRVLAREAQGFRDLATGQLGSPASLAASFFEDPEGRLVIQRRLRNHPELVRLTGTEALQTVRFQSLVTLEGECLLGGSNLKLVGGDSVTDNIAHGLSGNFSAGVRLEDGALRPPMAMSATGVGVEPRPRHPKTGLPLEGFRLPFWKEACLLVRRAALLFFPLQTIGWDVALTGAGPVLVEGNSWWDPPNELCTAADEGHAEEMAALLGRIRSEAARRRA